MPVPYRTTPRPPSDPLLAPIWVLAACAVLWTVMAAVWFVRAERAVSAAQDALREIQRRDAAREASRELSRDEDLARRLREK